jgi:predicted aldo/keto reductase-like oxidoreductase
MQKRSFGTTDDKVSVVGFSDIIVQDLEPKTASRVISKAIAGGVSYFDVSSGYGATAQSLGTALKSHRKNVFLASRTTKRTAQDAEVELRQSLEHLKTDHLDLYQLDAVTHKTEVDEILGSNGALEAFLKAREKGMVRFLGFSARTEEAALALLDAFRFDSVLFPLNYVSWYRSRFGEAVLEKAAERGTAVVAADSMAKQAVRKNEKRLWEKEWYHPVESFDEAVTAVRFALSKPVTTILSPAHEELFWWLYKAADQFTPLTDEEEDSLSREVRRLRPVFPLRV